MDEVFNQREIEEAERFADVLDTLEAGGQPDVEALMEAKLASLLRTADVVHETGFLATGTAAFDSYRARSRAYVLHTLEQQRRAAPVLAPGVIPFVVRHRRWTVFAPVAAAAAAAGLMLFTPFASAPGDGRPSTAANLTNLATSNDLELKRITGALATLTQRSTSGELVDASILRTITESTTVVANRIETQPQSVSKEHVESYQRVVEQSSTALSAVLPAVGTADALAAAQRATEDGKVTAARFLVAETTPTPTPAAGAAVTATPG
ncbi:MAG: hypothetical protein EXR68_01545 [Dehalococcoidia bacterium]|nr:hypothetical protein [Dehalococcoidia bacterium]